MSGEKMVGGRDKGQQQQGEEKQAEEGIKLDTARKEEEAAQ